MKTRTGWRSHLAAALLFSIFAAALLILGWRHITELAEGRHTNTIVIATAGFCYLAYYQILARLHHDIRPTPAQAAKLAGARVTVLIPIFNEDPGYFLQMLLSLDAQTRRPNNVIIVDDGSSSTECHEVFDRWYRSMRRVDIDAEYVRQDNAGKREAQARAARMDPTADFYVTLDSDVRLDRRAIELGLLPFTQRRTMSVAGMLLGDNHRKNLLTRLIELGFITSFLSGRAAHSVMGSVTVNAGGFAIYRAEVVGDNLARYLKQTVMGRKVSTGDDAMLTHYALQRGHTRFARNAFGYTLHPVNMKHLSKQRTRWARSFWWGSVWMLRNFSVRRSAWWMILVDLINAVWMAAVLPAVLIWLPIRTHTPPVGVFAIMAALAYIQNLLFLSVRRADEPRASQWLTYALAPLNALLNLYLGWVLTYVGLFTCAKTGWGTRTVVEVGAESC